MCQPVIFQGLLEPMRSRLILQGKPFCTPKRLMLPMVGLYMSNRNFPDEPSWVSPVITKVRSTAVTDSSVPECLWLGQWSRTCRPKETTPHHCVTTISERWTFRIMRGRLGKRYRGTGRCRLWKYLWRFTLWSHLQAWQPTLDPFSVKGLCQKPVGATHLWEQ